MLPCVRSCIGKKLNHLPAARADGSTGEPLLFLYPAWFRTEQKARYFTSSPPRAKHSHDKCTTLHDENDRSTPPIKTSQKPRKPARILRRSDSSLPRHDDRNDSRSSFRPVAWRSVDWDSLSQDAKQTHEKQLGSPTLRTQSKAKVQRGTSKYQSRPVDGLAIARELSIPEPTDLADRAVVGLSSSFLEWLAGTTEENFWKHHDGSGCVLHVRPSIKDDTQMRDVHLIGTSRAREITRQHLDQLQQEYYKQYRQNPKLDIKTTTKSTPLVWTRVDHIARPDAWSLRSFSQYISTIVNAQAPHAVERILYPKEESFNKIVAKILMETFHDPSLWSFQSSFALRQALKFCSTRTDIAFAATGIWIAAKRAGVIPDIACFNCEIARCLRVANAAGAVRLVREMHKLNIRPNGATWALLYGTLQRRTDRAQFLQLPVLQRTTHDQFSKDLAVQALIDQVFKPSDRVPCCVEACSNKMLDAFGDDWLTPSIVRTMIESCIEVNAPQTVSKVLELAAERSVELDAESFTTLLKVVGETNWFEDIIMLVKTQLASHPSDSPIGQRQMEQVFRQAWKHRLINTCRTLWHYAASHGTITHRMLQTVSAAVTQNKHPDTGSRYNATTWMAAIIIGTDYPVPSKSMDQAPSHDPETFWQAVMSLSRWAPKGEERHRQMQVAHDLLEREMTAWQRVSPMPNRILLDLLDQAFKMDMQWHKQERLAHASLLELLQSAVQIRLEPMPSTISLTADTKSISTKSEVPSQGIASLKLRGHDSDPSGVSTAQEPAKVLSWTHVRGFRAYSECEASSTFDCNGLRPHAPTSSVTTTASSLSSTTFVPIATLPFIDFLLHYLGLAWHD